METKINEGKNIDATKGSIFIQHSCHRSHSYMSSTVWDANYIHGWHLPTHACRQSLCYTLLHFHKIWSYIN